MVCLVCIDLVVVVVGVWVGECMGIWVSGFLVPSHYLLSGIWYLVLSPLLPISTWYFYFYWLLLTLTPGFYPYPWSLVMSLWVVCKFLAVWVVKWVRACYTGYITTDAPV